MSKQEGYTRKQGKERPETFFIMADTFSSSSNRCWGRW